MENKLASLFVVPLRKALTGIPPSWFGGPVLVTRSEFRNKSKPTFRTYLYTSQQKIVTGQEQAYHDSFKPGTSIKIPKKSLRCASYRFSCKNRCFQKKFLSSIVKFRNLSVTGTGRRNRLFSGAIPAKSGRMVCPAQNKVLKKKTGTKCFQVTSSQAQMVRQTSVHTIKITRDT